MPIAPELISFSALQRSSLPVLCQATYKAYYPLGSDYKSSIFSYAQDYYRKYKSPKISFSEDFH